MTTTQDFSRDGKIRYRCAMSHAHNLEADLRLVRATNASPLTGAGTNTFLIGRGQVCVIDPGPADKAHLAAILSALSPSDRVAAILVTHSHLDHSALAPRLSDVTGAPILAFGNSHAGRSDVMLDLATQGLTGGGEGLDLTFRPDRTLSDGESVTIGTETFSAIWTPGHMGNHMCFMWRDVVFCGDHVMGWSTSLVSPPDGDLGAFMRSLTRLEQLHPRKLYPAHGECIADPAQRIAELRAHRLTRERQILTELGKDSVRIADLVSTLYAETPEKLHNAAARNVYAHLIDLWERGLVTAAPSLTPDALYSLPNMSDTDSLL
jgi:glyoxylase-like metal-dependent hydrolase (beta-lactamase superfamily II)